MADQPVNQNNSDEIDLGQLFQMLRNGFNKLGVFFLRLFIYLKKSALILIGLVVLGVAIGYGLKFITTEKVQLDVIVRPNLESKDYLYDVISEIESNIKDKNPTFLNRLDITGEDLKGFEISIVAVKKEEKEDNEKQLEYLEVLQKFQNTDLIADVIREELLKKTELNHRITFTYKNSNGEEIARKLLDYINSNGYFTELLSVQKENSRERIEKSEVLISQIDTIIQSYSKNLNKQGSPLETGKLVLQNEERLNVTGLITLKTELIEDIEEKKMELKQLNGPISIINFGNPHQVGKAFFGKKIIVLPLLFIAIFFLLSFLKYLNRKASEIEV
ncbi:MAG TPA: hypothetical protein DEF18_14380 [Muricauda sp.]|nr:hypothetical protein [uncultured Allomuricauda sp.]MAO15871.1 hypothetical protein [Allomuricauda sp.]MBC71037.1 hypothetical protein [Allomuricauda sp.]HBU79283.1 hypothetical protein [Allomuricauda sp.]|tara:strand:- start:71 stop:1066 length:996 start_codon:yes stop_codon:yes gene_type:complete